MKAHTPGRRLHHPCELLPLFGDGDLDRSGNRRNQGYFCGRAQAQGGTHFLSEDFLRRFYRLNGAIGCRLHRAPLRIVGQRERTRLSLSLVPPPSPRPGYLSIWVAIVPARAPGVVGTPVSECSRPTANCPIGRASGSGANRVHSHRVPARTTVGHQARSRPTWVRAGPPVTMSPWLGPG